MLRLAFIVLVATFAMNGSIQAEEKTWLELNEEKKELKKKLVEQIACREKKVLLLSDWKTVVLSKLSDQNNHLIQQKTLDACKKLHFKNPDAAILNAHCRAAFTANLHPDLILRVYGELYNDVRVALFRNVSEIIDLENTQRSLQKLGIENSQSDIKVESLADALESCD
tara:strand:- start:148 stop:654 length:507 start_codon:yes stop_codon:yes gene_type:complete